MRFYGLNVLVFPAGTELGLEINDALRYSPHVNLYGGNSVSDFSKLSFENFDFFPSIDEDGFFDFINDYIEKNKIDVIIPTHDEVIYRLTTHSGNLKAHIINGDIQTAKTCRSKTLTYELFKEQPFCPKIYQTKHEVLDFPIFAKPDCGHGGIGARKINSIEELDTLERSKSNHVLVEYLPGEEVTIDCFTDRNGFLKVAQPRLRGRILGSITASAEFYEDEEIQSIASEINNTMSFRGGWFFQMKKNTSGSWKLMEVANRLSSSSVFLRAKGINLPLMSIHDFMGRDVSAVSFACNFRAERRYKTHLSFLNKPQHVYVDYDETIIVREKVNFELIAFLYQCVNKDLSVTLITRHEGDIYDSLRNYRISPELFDEIIHLKDGEKKSQFINHGDIFIDNHFLERLEVINSKGAHCFDTDSSSFLIY